MDQNKNKHIREKGKEKRKEFLRGFELLLSSISPSPLVSWSL